MTFDTISSEDPNQGAPFGTGGGGRAPMRSGARATALTTAVSLVLIGGVVTAAVRGSGHSGTAEGLAPASTFAFAQVDLSLADGQSSALSSFLAHFPDAPTKKGNGSLRDRVLRAMLRDSSDPHVDYDRDVKPWLGDHAAVAGWLDAAGKPQVEFMLQSKNDSAARTSLHRVAPQLGLRFSKGYAVLGQTQQLANAALAAAQKSSLSSDAHFHSDLAKLSGPQVIAGWLDVSRAGAALKHATKGLNPFATMPGLSFGGQSLQQLKGRAVIGLHATKTYAELVAQDIDATSASASGASTDMLTRLPDATIGAVEIASPGKIVSTAWGFLSGILTARSEFSASTTMPGAYSSTLSLACPPGQSCPSTPGVFTPTAPTTTRHVTRPPSPVDEIEKATGLKLPGDAVTLLGSAMVASYGGLQGGAPNIALVTRPADLSAARAIAEHSRDVISHSAGLDLAVDTAGTDLVVASNSAYATLVRTGGHLGTQARFTQAMGELPDKVGFAVYVDLADVLPLIAHGQRDADHFDSVGFWTGRVGNEDRMQFRLVVR